MRDDDAALLLLALLAFGGGGSALDAELGEGWVWPLPMLSQLAANLGLVRPRPEISDGFGSIRNRGTPQEHLHAGVDMMYRRVAMFPKGAQITDGGTRGFTVPAGVQALAAAAGRIWFAGRIATGWSVVLDHGPKPFSTYYTHLSDLAVPRVDEDNRGQIVVLAGQPLGTVGASPLDPQRVKHLHFELRHPRTGVDPQPAMRRWRYVS